jgi:hypothetical protein
MDTIDRQGTNTESPEIGNLQETPTTLHTTSPHVGAQHPVLSTRRFPNYGAVRMVTAGNIKVFAGVGIRIFESRNGSFMAETLLLSSMQITPMLADCADSHRLFLAVISNITGYGYK